MNKLEITLNLLKLALSKDDLIEPEFLIRVNTVLDRFEKIYKKITEIENIENNDVITESVFPKLRIRELPDRQNLYILKMANNNLDIPSNLSSLENSDLPMPDIELDLVKLKEFINVNLANNITIDNLINNGIMRPICPNPPCQRPDKIIVDINIFEELLNINVQQ